MIKAWNTYVVVSTLSTILMRDLCVVSRAREIEWPSLASSELRVSWSWHAGLVFSVTRRWLVRWDRAISLDTQLISRPLIGPNHKMPVSILFVKCMNYRDLRIILKRKRFFPRQQNYGQFYGILFIFKKCNFWIQFTIDCEMWREELGGLCLVAVKATCPHAPLHVGALTDRPGPPTPDHGPR